MNDATEIGWTIGPLPIIVTCVSLFFLTKALFGRSGYSPQYDYSVFGFVPGLFAGVLYASGVHRADEINRLVQVPVTVLALITAILLLAITRRRGGLPLAHNFGSKEPSSIVMAGVSIAFLLAGAGLFFGFDDIFVEVELRSCGRHCRGAVFMLGNVKSAFTALWTYLIFINFLSVMLVLVAARIAKRTIDGSQT